MPTSAEAHIVLPRQRAKQRGSARFSDCGMNAIEQESLHCVAAEPHATFLRVGVLEGKVERAYESMVLGRLRRGYRVIQLRGSLGTRIELNYLFVLVSFGTEVNVWMTPTQMRMQHVIEPSTPVTRGWSSNRLQGAGRGDPTSPRGRTDPVNVRSRRASGAGDTSTGLLGADVNDGRPADSRMQRQAGSGVRFRGIDGTIDEHEKTPDLK